MPSTPPRYFGGWYVWHARMARRPARLLAEALDCGYGTDLPDLGSNTTVIRYGKSGSPGRDNDFTVINGAGNVRLAANKAEALTVLDAGGVRVPKYGTDPTTLAVPLIGRTFHHFGGRGMKLYLQQVDVARLGESDYYLEYIPKYKEIRVHIAFGKSIKMSEKRYDPERGSKYDPLRWNRKYGMTFRRTQNVSTDEKAELRRIAKLAVHELGLDFGAVDIIMGEDGGMYVLEVNTAPSLNTPSTLNAYVRALNRWMNGQ